MEIPQPFPGQPPARISMYTLNAILLSNNYQILAGINTQKQITGNGAYVPNEKTVIRFQFVVLIIWFRCHHLKC